MITESGLYVRVEWVFTLICRVRQTYSISHDRFSGRAATGWAERGLTSGSLSQEERENKRLGCTWPVSSPRLANHTSHSTVSRRSQQSDDKRPRVLPKWMHLYLEGNRGREEEHYLPLQQFNQNLSMCNLRCGNIEYYLPFLL